MIRLARARPAASPDRSVEGERIWIRPPLTEDWRDWSLLREESRAFLTPWEPTWPADALSREAYLRRQRAIVSEWRAGEAYAFHTFRREDGRLVGGITLRHVRRGVAMMGVIGYWVGARFARQGYTAESVRLVLAFAFLKLGLHRVEAACVPRNEASRTLLEGLGFEREGYARGYLRINGTWEDHLLFGILVDDWQAQAPLVPRFGAGLDVRAP